MAKRPQCDDGHGDVTHKGFDKTNRTVPSLRPGGKPLEIWICQCGQKTHEVLPGKAKRDW